MDEQQASAWPQIIVHVGLHEREEVENALFSAGALSISYRDDKNQPVLEPKPGEVRLWDELSVIALFSQGQSVSECVNQLKEMFPKLSIEQEDLPDQSWERAWMDQFKPMQFGEQLWICPSHHKPPDPQGVNLMLDPGLAFGTGTHPTTAMCLEWLDGADLQGKSVLDFGCGSGVLAIAALMLGAGNVCATDIDPQAMHATAENAEANKVTEKLTLLNSEEVAQCRVDILIANILYQPLKELSPLFLSLLKPGGFLLMSGILDEQAEPLKQHYANDVTFVVHKQNQEWVALGAVLSGV